MTETIVLGGGCFWCTEAVFEMIRGVISTKVGYAGGTVENPTYEDVAYGGKTGHVEVAEVEYDPKIVPLEKLLEIFFAMHDPTSIDKQGVADYGPVYMSVIFYTMQEQKNVATKFIKDQQKKYLKPIVTEVKKLDRFYTAEEEHQKFYDKEPWNPYCIFVTRPEVSKIKKEFKEWLKGAHPD